MLTSKTNLFLQGIADRDLNVILQKGMRKLAMAMLLPSLRESSIEYMDMIHAVYRPNSC